MDSNYRPQSPDLSSYKPRSPDLSGLTPQQPDHLAFGPSHSSPLSRPGAGFGSPHFHPQHSYHQPTSEPHPRFGNPFAPPGPTSTPFLTPPESYAFNQAQSGMASSAGRRHQPKLEPADNDHSMPDAPLQPLMKRPKKGPTQAIKADPGSSKQFAGQSQNDPTLGVDLRTSFPVARIKRIMQADEDVGKVAQVTPHVVSRALELFMISLIAASAEQARAGSGSAAASKGPKKVLAQHMKKAIMSDDKFKDWLQDIAEKVPDAPTKMKKENTLSDSDEKPKKGRKKRGADDG